MRLRAISDLHLAAQANRDALDALPDFPDDWLIVAGDVAERFDHVRFAFEMLTARFAKVFWVPGNHDLWAIPEKDAPGTRDAMDQANPDQAIGDQAIGDRAIGDLAGLRALAGEARYRALVALAREYGIHTPEDPFQIWTGPGGPCVIAPLFLLYDYSFRPDHVAQEDVVGWAREESAVCADEMFLSPAPWPSREAWCAERIAYSERRLAEIPADMASVLVNHFPLREDLVHIPRAPRFAPWCGTRRTRDWHTRYNAQVVISGHIHIRRTDWRDGTRFEEVSLGYPRQWDQTQGMAPYLRDILPEAPATGYPRVHDGAFHRHRPADWG